MRVVDLHGHVLSELSHHVSRSADTSLAQMFSCTMFSSSAVAIFTDAIIVALSCFYQNSCSLMFTSAVYQAESVFPRALNLFEDSRSKSLLSCNKSRIARLARLAMTRCFTMSSSVFRQVSSYFQKNLWYDCRCTIFYFRAAEISRATSRLLPRVYSTLRGKDFGPGLEEEKERERRRGVGPAEKSNSISVISPLSFASATENGSVRLNPQSYSVNAWNLMLIRLGST